TTWTGLSPNWPHRFTPPGKAGCTSVAAAETVGAFPAQGIRRPLTVRDRVLVTLARLRLGLPHQALAVLYSVQRSTVSAAVRQVRPLLANRGFATPTGQRLHTLADVLAYAAAEGPTVGLDGTEIQVRRPKANRPGRRAFVSGQKKQNT